MLISLNQPTLHYSHKMFARQKYIGCQLRCGMLYQFNALYFPSTIFFYVYSEAQGPIYKSSKALFFSLDVVVVVVAKHQEVCSSSIPLCMYNLFIYTYICNIACLYRRHVVCMCDVFRIYVCMHKCLLVISVSFKPIYNQSERKALSFLIRTGCYFS